MTMVHHHKPFLWVGGDRAWPPCPRFGRSAPRTVARSSRERRGAREKPFDQDRRKIHDSQHQRVQSHQRGLEWIRVLRNVSCVVWEVTCPTGTGSCTSAERAVSVALSLRVGGNERVRHMEHAAYVVSPHSCAPSWQLWQDPARVQTVNRTCHFNYEWAGFAVVMHAAYVPSHAYAPSWQLHGSIVPRVYLGARAAKLLASRHYSKNDSIDAAPRRRRSILGLTRSCRRHSA